MDQNVLRASLAQIPGLDQPLPPISPASTIDQKQDANAQALQQLLANNAAAQRLLFLNSLANPLGNPLLANSLANPLLQAQLVNAALLGVANPLVQPPFASPDPNLVAPFQSPSLFPNPTFPATNPLTASNGGQPFTFQNPQFEFGSEGHLKKKPQRKRPIKMAQSTDSTTSAARVAAAQLRTRDEEGRFAPNKVQKTDALDLKLKLDTKEDEVNQLKEQIQQRDQLVSQLQKQLQDLQAENERQRSALYSLSDTDQLRLFHDARFIREFKARQQYLHEIEMAAQQRLAAILARTEEAQKKSAANTPTTSTPMSHPTPTPSVATPAQVEPPPPPPASSDTHHSTPQSAASEEHDSIEHMIMSPPASWIEEPWNQEIPRPFREKIDLSKIELKPVEPPPNLVENARMEYWEGQRRWQQQQEHVQRHMAQLGYSSMQRSLHGPPRYTPMPAFAEKIDLAEKLAQLRKTNANSSSNQVPSTPVNKMDEEGMQMLNMSPLISMEQQNDPMITDEMTPSQQLFGDSIDFLNSHEMNDLDFNTNH